MKITNITIKNFRSIEDVIKLSLDSFNVFVGQNNHGKTNFFEAVEWFYTDSGSLEDICYLRDTTKEVTVEIEFSGLQKALDFVINEKQKKLLTEIFGTDDLIRIRRSSSFEVGKYRQLFSPKTNSWENPLGRDSTWAQFLPTLEYVSTRKFLEDVAKYGRATPISRMLSAVLETMLASDKKYAEFRKMFNELFGDPEDPSNKTEVRKNIDAIGGTVATYLQKQFPDCTEVTFKVENPELEDLFKKFRTTVDDGVQNDSSEKGDGMQRALMLAIIEAYSNFRKQNGESKDFVFLIDEAELHLHPTAQRALKKALYEVSTAGDQVLINTHSSVLVVDDVKSQIIFQVQKINKVTHVTPICTAEKPYVIYELLGGSPSDLLLPRNFLIVEGVSDYIFLSGVIKRFYLDKSVIQIIYSEGDIDTQERSMNAINSAYVPLGVTSPVYKDKVIILCDKPNKAREKNRDEFLKAYNHLLINKQYFELTEDAIEKYYPNPWTKSESEIRTMNKSPNRDKIILAQQVSQVITQEQFEREMPVILQALQRCWELAY